jgi:hypothetical protein
VIPTVAFTLGVRSGKPCILLSVSNHGGSCTVSSPSHGPRKNCSFQSVQFFYLLLGHSADFQAQYMQNQKPDLIMFI